MKKTAIFLSLTSVGSPRQAPIFCLSCSASSTDSLYKRACSGGLPQKDERVFNHSQFTQEPTCAMGNSYQMIISNYVLIIMGNVHKLSLTFRYCN